MSTYGQFCPVAKAMEVLDERWTMLVLRELLTGSRHFNELRRGVPKMSPALLSKRLRSLERVGVIRRSEADGRIRYTVTECGEELRPVVEAIGAWGVRWIGELGEEDLDPHLLMWDVQRTVPVEAWPRGRTVLAFRFTDVEPKVGRWWLCVTGDEVDICDYDPGYEVTGTIESTLRTMVEIWRGDQGWTQAMRSGSVTVDGPRTLTREVPRWLGQSTLAVVPRPA
ncbi:MAG: helix-turn-helix transcriptional regulator [Nocardioidaceae bacterium]|nr:helix-turn-helix transcriptional regulator [Nocardioidaceae bacterium]NUS52064.1 helix-turn-helix transcriptional regulator [Nocardioidaceae bacterium]